MPQYNINTLNTHTNYATLPAAGTQPVDTPPAHYALMGSVALHDKATRPNRCGETFTRQDTLKRHIAESSGTFPHACPALGCGQSFKRPSHVKQHLRNVHGLDEATVSIMVPSGKGGARKGTRRSWAPSLATTPPGVRQHAAVSSVVAAGSMPGPVRNQSVTPAMFANQAFGVGPSDALNVGMRLDDVYSPIPGSQMEYGTAIPGDVNLMMNQTTLGFSGTFDVGPAQFDFDIPAAPLFNDGYAAPQGSSIASSNTMPMSSALYGLSSTGADASFVDPTGFSAAFGDPHVPQTGDGFGLNETALCHPLVTPSSAFIAEADNNHGVFTNPVLDPYAMLPATINSGLDMDFEADLGDVDLENFSFENLSA